MKISCIVVDDQSEAIELIADHIHNVTSFELKSSFTSSIDALAFLDKEIVDCIFLDIEMPQVSGLDFIETLKAKPGYLLPKIILITAYDRYALSGYDYGVFDYLLKPVTFKRFKICADRLLATLNQTQDIRDFLFVDVDGNKLKINFSDVSYVEGAGNYVIIATEEKKLISYRTMSSMVELLPPSKFIRVHKSFIVSIDKVNAIRGNEVLLTIKNAVKNIPIGTTYKPNLLKVLRITE